VTRRKGSRERKIVGGTRSPHFFACAKGSRRVGAPSCSRVSRDEGPGSGAQCPGTRRRHQSEGEVKRGRGEKKRKIKKTKERYSTQCWMVHEGRKCSKGRVCFDKDFQGHPQHLFFPTTLLSHRPPRHTPSSTHSHAESPHRLTTFCTPPHRHLLFGNSSFTLLQSSCRQPS